MHPSPTAETLKIHTIQHRMCVTCVYLRGQTSVGSFRSSKSPSLTNLCMHLFTRSLTTLRERTIRQMCPPWPRLPPRMAPRSTFFPSQRSLCPSPNNLADPVRDHRCCLQIGPAFHFAKLLFMFSCCPFPAAHLHTRKYRNGSTVCENGCPAVPFSPHSSYTYTDISGFCSCYRFI